jgi:Carboxypeptidase regulatory-like domain
MKKQSVFPFRMMACVLLVVLSTALANAATVRGRLVHSNGYPAAGMAVTVYNQVVGRSSPAYAGRDGMYFLYNIPPGYYYLEVWLNPGKPIVYQIQVVEPYTDVAQIGVP